MAGWIVYTESKPLNRNHRSAATIHRSTATRPSFAIVVVIMIRTKVTTLVLGALLIVFAVPPESFGQSPSDRYQLGWRLRRFESAFEKDTSEESRKRVLQPMQAAVGLFFSRKFSEASARLDEAYLFAAGLEDCENSRAAAALQLADGRRVFDLEEKEMTLEIMRNYQVSSDFATGRIHFRLFDLSGNEVLHDQFDLENEPQSQTIDLPGLEQGDYRAELTLETSDATYLVGRPTFSFIENYQSRYDEVEAALTELRWRKPDSLNESAAVTARGYNGLSFKLFNGEPSETDFESSRYLEIAESIARRLREQNADWLGENPEGEYRLKLCTDGKTATVRIFVPEYEAEKKLPVVFAMHGAGGSENFFFDGYGDGKIVKLCREREWIVVSPRLNLMFGQGLDIDEMLNELEKLFPVDRERVMLVGHSMGGATVLGQIYSTQTPYVAAAVIAGGSPVPESERFASVPLFVATGEFDFGSAGAKGLAESLEQHGYDHEFKNYPSTEHMAIVQIALDEVFAYFDEKVRRTKIESAQN